VCLDVRCKDIYLPAKPRAPIESIDLPGRPAVGRGWERRAARFIGNL
jgi:hypothetical protein